MKAKFKAGDVLKPVLDDTRKVKLHVVEVITQTCPANIEQVRYGCRAHIQRFKDAAPAISLDLISFNEMEVELF